MDDWTENASARAAPANTAVVTLVENFIVIYVLACLPFLLLLSDRTIMGSTKCCLMSSGSSVLLWCWDFPLAPANLFERETVSMSYKIWGATCQCLQCPLSTTVKSTWTYIAYDTDILCKQPTLNDAPLHWLMVLKKIMLASQSHRTHPQPTNNQHNPTINVAWGREVHR